MEEWAVILLTGLISLVTSVVTSRITLSVTQKNDVRKHILQERTDLYLELFPVIDELVNWPENVFDDEYMDEFISYKADMKLLASSETFKAYIALFDVVIEPYNFADIYTGYKNGEDTSDFNPEIFSKLKKEDLDLEPEEFADKFMPDRDKICRLIQNLYQKMREDLGSNIK